MPQQAIYWVVVIVFIIIYKSLLAPDFFLIQCEFSSCLNHYYISVISKNINSKTWIKKSAKVGRKMKKQPNASCDIRIFLFIYDIILINLISKNFAHCNNMVIVMPSFVPKIASNASNFAFLTRGCFQTKVLSRIIINLDLFLHNNQNND